MSWHPTYDTLTTTLNTTAYKTPSASRIFKPQYTHVVQHIHINLLGGAAHIHTHTHKSINNSIKTCGLIFNYSSICLHARYKTTTQFIHDVYFVYTSAFWSCAKFKFLMRIKASARRIYIVHCIQILYRKLYKLYNVARWLHMRYTQHHI